MDKVAHTKKSCCCICSIIAAFFCDLQHTAQLFNPRGYPYEILQEGVMLDEKHDGKECFVQNALYCCILLHICSIKAEIAAYYEISLFILGIAWILMSSTQLTSKEWWIKLHTQKKSGCCICSIIAAFSAICSILHNSLTLGGSYMKFCRREFFVMRNMMVRKALVKMFCFAAYCCISAAYWPFLGKCIYLSIYLSINCLLKRSVQFNNKNHNETQIRMTQKNVAADRMYLYQNMSKICHVGYYCKLNPLKEKKSILVMCIFIFIGAILQSGTKWCSCYNISWNI